MAHQERVSVGPLAPFGGVHGECGGVALNAGQRTTEGAGGSGDVVEGEAGVGKGEEARDGRAVGGDADQRRFGRGEALFATALESGWAVVGQLTGGAAIALAGPVLAGHASPLGGVANCDTYAGEAIARPRRCHAILADAPESLR